MAAGDRASPPGVPRVRSGRRHARHPHPRHPCHPCAARLWLLGLAVLVACSWCRFLATGSLKVDESYPSEAAGTALLAALAAGWALLVAGWRGLLERPPPRPRLLAFVGLSMAALMLPMVSNDVHSLFAYGALAGRGVDVYTTAARLPESPFFRFIGEHWDDRVCVYGPTTLLAMTPAALAKGNPWVALAFFRAVWLLPLAVVMELSLRRMADRPWFHVMVWLNPLWILEGPGQMHADLLGVTAIVAGIVALERRPVLGWAAFAWAVLGKYSFVFTAPYFWLVGAERAQAGAGAGARARARAEEEARARAGGGRVPAGALMAAGAGMAAVVGALGVVAFAPFWRGPATLTEPLRALSQMNPGGSLTEIAGHLVHLARGGSMTPPDLPVHEALAIERATKGGTWLVASLVLRAVALVIGVRVLAEMLRRRADREAVALGTGILVVAALTLASHRFQSWYLAAALPFFGLRCTDAWRRWWVAAVAVVTTPQFVYVLPRTARVLPPWAGVSTAAAMVVFVAWFWSRYLAPGLLGEAAATPASRPEGGSGG